MVLGGFLLAVAVLLAALVAAQAVLHYRAAEAAEVERLVSGRAELPAGARVTERSHSGWLLCRESRYVLRTGFGHDFRLELSGSPLTGEIAVRRFSGINRRLTPFEPQREPPRRAA